MIFDARPHSTLLSTLDTTANTLTGMENKKMLGIPLVEAQESISGGIADADIAKKLDIQRKSPLLVQLRVSFTANMRPLEHTTTYYRADHYEYKIRLAREGV